MSRRRSLSLALSVTAAGVLAVPLAGLAPAASGSPGNRAGHDSQLARSAELSATTRLADRRSFVIGDRFYEVGAEDGSYPAEGFHTRGEMGGFWSMPIKLLDGVWFGVDGSWLTAHRYSTGWGYTRMDLGTHDGVAVSRTDVAPDGLRAGLIGLDFHRGARPDREPDDGRALRAHEGLPVGRDHAQPDGLQPARHRYRRQAAIWCSARTAPRRSRTPPRTTGRRWSAPRSPRQRINWALISAALRTRQCCVVPPAPALRRRRPAATTRLTAKAPAGS